MWHLSGPYGRLLQDGEFYETKIKDNYGVDKLPKIPGNFWAGHTLNEFKSEKKLMDLLKQSQSWPLDGQLVMASVMGSLVLVKYLVSQGVDMRSPSHG